MCCRRCPGLFTVGVFLLGIPGAIWAADSQSARTSAVPAVQFDVDAPPLRDLGQHHFFIDAARQIPNRRVVPYDLNTPHRTGSRWS